MMHHGVITGSIWAAGTESGMASNCWRRPGRLLWTYFSERGNDCRSYLFASCESDTR
jgi:hypothetical protein